MFRKNVKRIEKLITKLEKQISDSVIVEASTVRLLNELPSRLITCLNKLSGH